MPTAQQTRNFAPGEKVRIKKKTHIVDKEREHEHLQPEDRIPIEENVTGMEVEISGTPYQSPTKGDEYHVPCTTEDGGMLGVPLDRLERVGPTAVREDGYGGGGSGVSRSTMEFWKRRFAADIKKELRAEIRKEIEHELQPRKRQAGGRAGKQQSNRRRKQVSTSRK